MCTVEWCNKRFEVPFESFFEICAFFGGLAIFVLNCWQTPQISGNTQLRVQIPRLWEKEPSNLRAGLRAFTVLKEVLK